jgi:geranylgeranyl diphosphate synthase type II
MNGLTLPSGGAPYSTRSRPLSLRKKPEDYGGSISSALESYAQLIRRQMLADISDMQQHPQLRAAMECYPRRGGKCLRPALCLGTAQAFGGDLEKTLNSAVALELMHNAFLIHDDIEDGSYYRRGQPTLHAEYGTAIAINAGDAMSAVSARLLLRNRAILGPELAWRVASEFEHLGRQSVEGQAIELSWMHDNVIDLVEADYLRMVLKKTCWYSAIHPCRIGAMIGSADCNPDSFDRFGFYFGAAYQIRDDVLNIIGDEAAYGKEIGGDLLEGKRSLILIHLIGQSGPGDRNRILRFLSVSRSDRNPGEALWLRERMIDCGSVKYAQSCASDLACAAINEFGFAYARASEGPKRFIKDLIHYAVERNG